MSLTNRVCAFFLAALGTILAVYSLVFYSVTRAHIDAQFESEMHGVLKSLIAAAEVEETEVKWQPLEHSIDFGVHDEFGEVQWVVVGDGGLIVERSRYAENELLARIRSNADLAGASKQSPHDRIATTDDLVVMHQQVSAPRPVRSERELDEFDTLTIYVGRSTHLRDSILLRLTSLVILLPLLVWSLAAIAGRWVVRQALRPVSEMAKQAQSFTGADFRARLRHGNSGDELTELGAAFNRLLDRQQIAFERQQRFSGDAAHELRTPITVLLGQIEVTLLRPRSEGEYQANLELLRSQTRTLQEIVESLLFLARSEGDSDAPPLRRVNLRQWLNTQAVGWSAHPRSCDLQLENQWDDHACVQATPALLGRVVDNLVLNALKYSEAGTPVVIRASEAGGQLLLQVIDAGPGIDEADVPQLFEPFFRSGDARRRGIAGTGLGLAIAARISEVLGAKLTCESTVGAGSCFSVRLPRIR